ncbi:AChain A, pyruvate, phosphate dikinase, chloroplastic [Tanacetum coccineum]
MIVQLISMIVSVINDPKYDIAGVANHFLHLRLLRILRFLEHGDADASDFMNVVLAKGMCLFSLAAMYGVVVAALGMLSTITTRLAIDTYGPISDNAGGIAEMAVMIHHICERTNFLDAVGNTTAAIRKMNHKISTGVLAGATALWVLFELLEYHLKTNPVIAEIFSLMSRDEARHAGYIFEQGIVGFQLGILDQSTKDIEFTVQENRLWMLQCRSGKHTRKGAVRIAVNMVDEKLIDTRTSIMRVEPQHLDQLLHPQFEDASAYKSQVMATGLPASPCAAVGQVVFSAADAESWQAQAKSAILVRTETSPEDVGGLHAAAEILTARGGMTSPAAVVTRGWGKCCVSGCADIRVNDDMKILLISDLVIREGEWISLNGSTGEVILGKQPLAPPAMSSDLETFMAWEDQVRSKLEYKFQDKENSEDIFSFGSALEDFICVVFVHDRNIVQQLQGSRLVAMGYHRMRVHVDGSGQVGERMDPEDGISKILQMSSTNKYFKVYDQVHEVFTEWTLAINLISAHECHLLFKTIKFRDDNA